MNDLFDFEWSVDEAGYDWIAEGTTILTQRWRLQPRGGPLNRYQPFEHPGLAREFARLPLGRDAARDFTNRWGLLDEHAGARFDEFSARRRRVAAWFAMLDFRVPENAVISGAEVAAIAFNEQARVALDLRLDTSRRLPRLSLAPRSLYGALLVQVARAIASVQAVTDCLNCGKPLAIGPGQGATRRKKFCSDRCRAAWRRRELQED